MICRHYFDNNCHKECLTIQIIHEFEVRHMSTIILVLLINDLKYLHCLLTPADLQGRYNN